MTKASFLIVHPLASSHLSLAKKGPLKCAQKVETAKLIKYSDHCRSQQATFIPFIIESFGGFTQTATKLINLIARFAHSSSTSNNSLSFSETEVLADIAIANQIGHSHSISSYLAAVTA